MLIEKPIKILLQKKKPWKNSLKIVETSDMKNSNPNAIF